MTKVAWKSVDGEDNYSIISGDGVGYYQYLVSLFIENNFSHQELKGAFMKPVGERVVNKCFVGTAVCMSPFFGCGLIHHSLVGEEVNAYSLIMQRWINFGGIVYLLLGFFFLYRWLSSFDINERTISITIVCLLLGTNLFLYSILSPSMTHVYSFFSVCAFLYFTRSFFLKSLISRCYFAAFFFGLIILIRPANGIILLLLPFLAGGLTPFLRRWKTIRIHQIIFAGVITASVLLIQSGLWYIQTGHWLVWSYGEEGFYFTNPQLYEVLFGFRKGWFVYTPLALVSLLGLFFQFRKNKEQFFYLTSFLFVIIYITASWWNWFYGSSFGQRPFIDFYALVAYLLAVTIQQPRPKVLQGSLYGVLVMLIGLNLIQTYQYKENLISSWDMTYEKYKATFLVTEVEKVKIGGNRDPLPYKSTLTTKLDTLLHFITDPTVQKALDSSSQKIVADFSNKEYNLALNHTLSHRGLDSKGNLLNLELKRLEKTVNNSENAKMIILLKDSLGEVYYDYWFLMNEVPSESPNTWKTYQYQVFLPSLKTKASELIVFIRNEDKASFYVDDFRVKLNSLN